MKKRNKNYFFAFLVFVLTVFFVLNFGWKLSIFIISVFAFFGYWQVLPICFLYDLYHFSGFVDLWLIAPFSLTGLLFYFIGSKIRKYIFIA